MILDGKVIIVTGAARGFGSGIARAVGKAGAKVCAVDINENELNQTSIDLSDDGTESLTRYLDVSDLDGFKSIVKEVVGKWGRLDGIIQNAVVMPLILFEETSEDNYWRQLHVSLGGIFNATKAAWEIFKDQGGGHIIGIASGSSIRGFKRETSYCTGKHGQEGFAKAIALEAAPYRISINTMGPGASIKPTDISREEFAKLPEVVRYQWADPMELGKAFVWLLHQNPGKYSGYRFDAGPIALTVKKEGYDFDFSPEKTTLYPEDFNERQNWYNRYPDFN